MHKGGELWVHWIEEAKKLNCALEFSKTWVKIHTDDLNKTLTLIKQTDRISLKGVGIKGNIYDPYKR